MTVRLSEEYALVLGVAGLSWIVHYAYMGASVSKARKKYKIKYPNMYASSDCCASENDIYRFNCVQRAHQNSLENQPGFLALLMGAGIANPITAATLGMTYLAGRVVYFAGYSSGNPSKRHRGAVQYIGALGLLGICLKEGGEALVNCFRK